MGTFRRHMLLLAAIAASLALAGCGTGGGSSSGAAPPTSGGGPSTPYVPASGTDQTGILFPTYQNKAAGYTLLYPGGWRIAEKAPAGVRISRFGNAITVVVTARKSIPFYKGYQKTLEKQLADPKTTKKQLSKIDVPASEVKIGSIKAVRAVIEQVRPTGTTTPEETIVVVRYLFWKSGKLLTLSMSSVKGINNTAAYDLIANSLRW
jgi:hypothetical protein